VRASAWTVSLSGLLALAAAALAQGCARPAPPEALAAAVWTQGQENRWGEAMPQAKACVLARPDDAGAHYLLAKCYLNRPDPHLNQAEGELRFALALFERTGSPGLVEDLVEGSFEAALHRDLALTCLRWAREGIRLRLPPDAILAKLRESRDHVGRGLAIDPQNKFLNELKEELDGITSGEGKPPAVAQPLRPSSWRRS